MRPVLASVPIGAILVAVAAASCSRAREYEVRGQIVAVNVERREITLRHEDIRGFMPGMTMPFKVRDARLLAGRQAGDLVTARLVVEDTEAHLAAIEKTGHAPLAEPAPPPPPELLSTGDPVPDATLLDQGGRTRRLSEWRGQAVAVTFIYTRCPLPDFCPLMDRNFAAVQREIANDATLRGGVHLLSVSFDPEYDTPKVLAAHARRVGADAAHWTMLTGTRDQVDGFASKFGISIVRSGEPQSEIVHNLRTAVIDPEGRLAAILPGNEWKPHELLTHLKAVRR